MIKITKRSICEFQFGDDQPIVKFDVIEVSDQWHEINFALRVLENDMWVLPANKVNEHGKSRLEFVQGLLNAAYGEAIAPTLTRAEAEEFIKYVNEEVEKVRNFIFPKSVETSSPPASTETESGTFSQ